MNDSSLNNPRPDYLLALYFLHLYFIILVLYDIIGLWRPSQSREYEAVQINIVGLLYRNPCFCGYVLYFRRAFHNPLIFGDLINAWVYPVALVNYLSNNLFKDVFYCY